MRSDDCRMKNVCRKSVIYDDKGWICLHGRHERHGTNHVKENGEYSKLELLFVV